MILDSRTLAPGGRLSRDDRIILRSLRRGPLGRAALAEATGWSRNTVTSRLGPLRAAGWIRDSGEARDGRGRPFQSYELDPRAALVFTLRVSATTISGSIVTYKGETLAHHSHALAPGGDAETVQAHLWRLLEMLSAQPGMPRDRVRACVIGVPGPVSGHARTVPWSRVGELPEDLSQRLGVPVLIENDANLLALGEKLARAVAGAVVYLLVQRGLGAGIALDRGLHRGIGGWAGELGHVPVPAAGDTPCICGNRGCLAAIANDAALLRAVSVPGRPVTSMTELLALIEQGDLGAVMAMRQAGRTIGEAITGVVVGLAPEVVLVGGPVVQSGDHLMAGLRESLMQRMPPALSAQIVVEPGGDTDAVTNLAAADLAFDHLCPPVDGW